LITLALLLIIRFYINCTGTLMRLLYVNGTY